MISTSLRGARTHNLQGVDLDLRSGELTVLAGPSGAGKSSLARHTLHAEGQRRYVESFSAYARQFLERLPRPPLASLEPVPVSVAVDRQAPVRTSRSTVGTLTEINDYLKDLWAHAATLMCPGCDVPVQRLDSHQWAARLIDKHRGDRLVVTFALPLGPPGSAKQAQNEAEQGQRYLALRDALTHEGYGRVVLDAGMQQLDQVAPSQVLASCRAEGWLPVVLDRLEAAAGMEARLSAALDAAFARGQGMAVLWRLNAARQLEPCGRIFQGLVCSACGARFQPPTPGLFSFNSAAGACPTCRGFGRVMAIDMDKVIPDPTLSLAAGAIRPWQGSGTQWERKALARHGRRAGVPLDVPVGALTPAQRRWLIEGESAATSAEGELEAQEQDGCWWGIRGWFRWLEGRTYKMHVRVLLSRYRRYDTCPDCQGTRLRPEALQWRMAGLRLPDFWQLSAAEAVDWLQARQAEWQAEGPAGRLLQQCLRRLKTLVEVGLPYLSLAREARTLSGGEAQRVALTSALGAELSDALFVLDEPTVGLHPRDTARLLGAVRGLCQDGNTVLVVEHDPEVLRAADRVVELGPGSGAAGGRIVYDGTPAQLAQADTATAAALRQTVTASHQPCGRAEPWLTLKGARGHNLQGVDLRLPLGRLTAITGVSGSGKSSLLRATLVPRLQQHCGQTPDRPALPHDGLSGAEPIRKVVEVDQSPLSRTPRANAATFTKAWDIVRQRFAAEPLAMQRAYTASTFSFNTEGGRCEACKGQGFETVEMQFLADITFSCASCQGRRFREEVLEVRHRGWNVAEVLTASVDEALQRFAADAALCKRLQPLREVGLGHLPLGQPLSQLSGGEAQRLKLAEALGACSEPSLLVLDEPSAGLHHVDVQPLMAALRRLVAAGHTVVLIEHDMHLAAQADHLIEMGPDAGDAGGHIVQTGTPRQVAQRDCLSAPYLRAALGTASMPQGPGQDACADHDVDLDAPVLAKAAAGMIRLRGATEHNLKGVDLDVPRGKLVAFTGPSGSGKSSLVFDVLYSEAQRRYFETLSPYARQYMAQLPRAHVEHIRGLPPAVALSQRQSVGGQQSTVATMTEVAQHLRLLFARVGTLHCPDCDLPVARGERTQLLQHAGAHFDKRRQVQVYAPLVRQRKGHYRELLARLHEAGIAAVRVDGTHQPLTAGMQLARHKLHDIDAFLGAARVGDAAFAALLDAALARGDGQVQLAQDERQLTGSLRRACPGCARVFPELDPRLFSFNTTLGACSACAGCGVVDAAKTRGARSRRAAPARTCSACGGSRLSTLARCVRVGARNIADVLALDIDAAAAELATWSASGPEGVVIRTLVDACLQRLSLLLALGLGYLALDRSAASLSGGEAQRVRLAAQLGSGLSGVLYVLDEPTIGLHARDTTRLLTALRQLTARGNTVCVVEHDLSVVAAADHVVDMGPTGGRDGGHICRQGSPAQLQRAGDSSTGAALGAPLAVASSSRVQAKTPRVQLLQAHAHNLQHVDLHLPLGAMTVVTGVSGSGKSTLIRQLLQPAVRAALHGERFDGAYKALRGASALRRVLEVDQSPVGRTPRSVPATYLGIWDTIRKQLAGTPSARAYGFGPAHFSFNTAGGRCEACAGQGTQHMEMAFLPPVHLPCARCGGQRFAPDVLEVRYKGLHVGDILDLDIAAAAACFAAIPAVRRPLEFVQALGLGYLKLGQPSHTLSGGEAQRIKLAAELGAGKPEGALYILDEPSTGLHRGDVTRLIAALQGLVQRGATLVVIEHQLDVVAAADWVVDLGPEGGAGGGQILFAGPPQDLLQQGQSATADALRQELAAGDGATQRDAARQRKSRSRRRTSGKSMASGGASSTKRV